MFSQVCVKNFVHRRGMHGRGTCMAGCMHGRGHVWQRHAWQGGMHGSGHVWQGACVVRGERVCQGVCMAGETATAVDGTHPTGLHSCLHFVITMFVDF